MRYYLVVFAVLLAYYSAATLDAYVFSPQAPVDARALFLEP